MLNLLTDRGSDRAVNKRKFIDYDWMNSVKPERVKSKAIPSQAQDTSWEGVETTRGIKFP